MYAWPISSDAEICRGPVTLESPHNYSANTTWEHSIVFAGATSITVSFDPRSKTERVSDMFTIRERTRRGRVLRSCSGTDFPGVGDVPDFVVESNKVGLKFESDGSNQDWGWKVTLTPHGMPSQ